VRAITEDALAAFRYSFAVLASDPEYAGYAQDSLEARVRGGFLTLPQERQALYVEQARSVVQAQPRDRELEFGRHGRRSPEEVRRLGFEGLFTGVQFDQAGLVHHIRSRAAVIEEKARVAEALAAQRAIDYRIDPRIIKLLTIKKLELRLSMVKCIDETNWWGTEVGVDEIEIGGEKIDHQGTATKVSKFYVGEFEDNYTKLYVAPGKLFSSFDLTAAGAWGRTYTNVVMMAEQDWGGFAEVLTEAWEKIKEKVNAEIVEAVLGLLPGGSVTAAIQEALEEALAWLVSTFVSWLIGLFDDDIFPPVIYSVELPSKWSWLYNNPADLGWTNHKLPPVSAYFTGHGGQYKVNMRYELVS
jgi:hypothetical protein